MLGATSEAIFFKGWEARTSVNENPTDVLHGYGFGFSCYATEWPEAEIESLYNASTIYGKEFKKSDRICPNDMICTVLNEKDEELSTKVCNERNICLTRKYSTEKDILNICYRYNEKGICTCGGEAQYYKGKLVSDSSCKEWSENNYCTKKHGSIMSYNSDGRLINFAYCKSWDKQGNCTVLNSGWINRYNSNGQYLGYIGCEEWESLGVCKKYGRGTIHTYDKKGKLISKSKCQEWDEYDTCKVYTGTVCYPNRITTKAPDDCNSK